MNREPIFNIPPVVLAVLAVLALVHLVRTLLLTEQQDIEFLLTFAFIPARYDNSVVLGGTLPGGGADIWTFVTYALIHADWTHFGVNAVWLLPFGSAVARRFGTPRFLAFLRRHFGGWCWIASGHASWRTVPDDRCLGGDLGHHGCGDALRIPAGRAARIVSRRRRSRLSRSGNTADRGLA